MARPCCVPWPLVRLFRSLYRCALRAISFVFVAFRSARVTPPHQITPHILVRASAHRTLYANKPRCSHKTTSTRHTLNIITTGSHKDILWRVQYMTLRTKRIFGGKVLQTSCPDAPAAMNEMVIVSMVRSSAYDKSAFHHIHLISE